MESVDRTVDYFKKDFHKGLFPLDMNRIIIENSASALSKYIYERILNDQKKADHFLPQARCYVAKHGLHLRRTLKLDPVAEFYIYDLISRNRNSFRKDFSNKRLSFGHKFDSGQPLSLSHSYREFKKSISGANRQYKYALKLDIASYFNSIYHHDLVKWFDDGVRNKTDVEGLGQFLREINSGRSIDCLPQGIHPCKVIGAEFLKFIDNARLLQSELMLRFMDDIYLFSDNQQKIEHDFIVIQQLIGEKGLNLNDSKTKYGEIELNNIDTHIEEVRKQLLSSRTEIVETYGGFEEVIVEEETNLSPEQEEYLYSLLKDPNLEEMDAELILTFMGDKGSDVLRYLEVFFNKYPNLK